MFRLLAAISWASSSLAYQWTKRTIATLRRYDAALSCLGSEHAIVGHKETGPVLRSSPKRASGGCSRTAQSGHAGCSDGEQKANCPPIAQIDGGPNVNGLNFEPPNLDALTRGLNVALGGGQFSGPELVVLGRERNLYRSTYPSEIITCCWSDGRTAKLMCKYGPAHTPNSFGHRGGISYETKIHSHILQFLKLPTACYRGSYLDNSTNMLWLFVDYLEGTVRIRETSEPCGMLREAAQWIGQFHLAAESRRAATDGWTIVYDFDYYDGWIARTLKFTEGSHSNFPWLLELCRQSQLCFKLFSDGPSSFIHGEYYPSNILAHGGRIVPVDWESAARAAGEIDLAMLTDGWPQSDVDGVVEAYRAARWPDLELPDDFGHRLRVAELYVQFRWLGDSAWSARAQPRRLEMLGRLGRQLQLV
jgi:hypothetical protein